jgi:P-type E1-E2 ATPase
VSTFMAFYDVRKNLLEVRRLSGFHARVRVLRGGSASPLEVDSAELVPGDVLVVQQGQRLPADVALIAGQVAVDEAVLTGEATVVSKQALPPGLAPCSAEPRHTLYGGATVVQLRVTDAQASAGGVRAVVLRTGFDSVKGRLLLSILFPRAAAHFAFTRHALAFIGLLALLAFSGFVLNVKALLDYGGGAGIIIQRGFDMVRRWSGWRSGLSGV